MSDPHLLELFVVERLRRALLRLALQRLAAGERLRARHLAGLELRLEAAQRVLHLRDRLVALDLLHGLAELAGHRVLRDLDVDLGAAVAGRVLEGDLSDGVVVVLGDVPAALDLIARQQYRDGRLVLGAHGANLPFVIKSIPRRVPGRSGAKPAAAWLIMALAPESADPRDSATPSAPSGGLDARSTVAR